MRLLDKIAAAIPLLFVLTVPAFAQVPDRLKEIREDIWDGQHFNGEAERGAFVEQVICAFRPSPDWKHLKKFGGQNNHNGHAVDAILHVPTGYAVDIATDMQPIWLRDAEPLYADPRFVMEPINCGDSPAPTPDPEPPPADLSKILQMIDTLTASVAAIDSQIAALKAKLEAEETARVAKDVLLEVDVTELKARKIPMRCRVPLLGCRLE